MTHEGSQGKEIVYDQRGPAEMSVPKSVSAKLIDLALSGQGPVGLQYELLMRGLEEQQKEEL